MASPTTLRAEEDRAGTPRPLRTTAAQLLTSNGLLVVLLVWVVVLALATDGFATRTNVLLVLRQSSTIGIVAIGATLVILLGEIDLSLGAVVSVSGVIAAKLLLDASLPVLAAGAAAVLVGAVCGLVNGLLVTVLRINSFMATLATMTVLGGAAFLLTAGRTLFGAELGGLVFLANGYVAGVPFPVILLFLCYLAAWVMLTRTGYGARLYAVGNNARASFLAGIRVDLVKAGTFGLAGALAGFGGLLQVSRLNAASGGLGTDLLFPVITAVRPRWRQPDRRAGPDRRRAGRVDLSRHHQQRPDPARRVRLHPTGRVRRHPGRRPGPGPVASPMTTPLLAVRGLTRTYPGVRALRAVSFDIGQAQLHALLGENGAGKSTLLRIHLRRRDRRRRHDEAGRTGVPPRIAAGRTRARGLHPLPRAESAARPDGQ